MYAWLGFFLFMGSNYTLHRLLLFTALEEMLTDLLVYILCRAWVFFFLFFFSFQVNICLLERDMLEKHFITVLYQSPTPSNTVQTRTLHERILIFI